MFLDRPPAAERRLERSDTFGFACHPEIPCFNGCCKGKHLPLGPYDVLRLKNALGLSSDDFLARYALYRTDPESGFPILSLKPNEDAEKTCPFVTEGGCSVYADRPMACRLFPLGRSCRLHPILPKPEEIFYRLGISGCLGLEERNVQTVEEWTVNQGIAPYTDANDQMLDLLFHPRRHPGQPLKDSQLRMVIVACYNLDVFREFVRERKDSLLVGVGEDVRSQVEKDDGVLLGLAFMYLRKHLFV